MSRDRNKLQRHIEDCLAARHEMREWISRAQALSPFIQVTESDWCRYGHLPPHAWLYERELDEGDFGDDWEWGDETWGAPELEEHDDWPLHESEGNDWRSLEEDWEEYQEPLDAEYGNCHYPAEHVRDARALRED